MTFIKFSRVHASSMPFLFPLFFSQIQFSGKLSLLFKKFPSSSTPSPKKNKQHFHNSLEKNDRTPYPFHITQKRKTASVYFLSPSLDLVHESRIQVQAAKRDVRDRRLRGIWQYSKRNVGSKTKLNEIYIRMPNECGGRRQAAIFLPFLSTHPSSSRLASTFAAFTFELENATHSFFSPSLSRRYDWACSVSSQFRITNGLYDPPRSVGEGKTGGEQWKR